MTSQLECRAQRELDELLLRECIMWKEKAKATWLQEGDANTRFFHLTIVIHRSHNLIQYILNNDNSRIVEYDQIATLFIGYYSQLFTSVNLVCPSDCQELFQPTITDSMNASLTAIPDITEIHRAVFQMASNKSPGPDGMSPVFYKSFWPIIGHDLQSSVADFFTNKRLCTTANHTFITLIPKKSGANRVEHFRPIALCNVAYKVITKILATRMKPLLDALIHPT